MGTLLAWLVASDPQRDDRHVAKRSLVVVASFAALVYAPICAYFLIFAADWSYAYLVPSAAVPSAVELLVVVIDAASVVAGFALGRRVLRRRDVRPALFLVLGPLAAILVAIVMLSRRLRVGGTYRQYHADFGVEPITGSAIGYGLLWMFGMLFVGLVVTARELAPHSGVGLSRALGPRRVSPPDARLRSRSD
jgi:hypothetical protein